MMEYYSAMKGKEVLIHATIWMNLANFMLSERNQTQKTTYYDSISVNRQIHRPRK